MQNAETTVCACGTVQAQGTTSTESSPLTVTAHITLYRASEARLDREEIGQCRTADAAGGFAAAQDTATPSAEVKKVCYPRRSLYPDQETSVKYNFRNNTSSSSDTTWNKRGRYRQSDHTYTNMQIMSLEALRRSP
ncbi:hypothetical protein Bbelb_411090 [Branchiostoma belcheri]|nr:hypothetical protein Bbelb_411090 [Branchiostoma belcheri]